MSITNSLYIGISGLRAHGDAISTVGDNIANTSTIGFKRSRASFSDLLGGEMGTQRLGGGVYLGRNQTMWEQGSIVQTGNPLDVGITGGGMFVLGGRNGQFFTRDGRFMLDAQGMMVAQNGLRLQGYTITNGVRTTSVGDLPLGARQSLPQPSADAKMTLNLDANSLIPPTWDPANPNATSSYSTSLTVHDSLGAAHRVEVHFRNQGGGNWEWHATVDGADVGATAGTPVEIANGSLAFDATGKLQSQATAMSSASFVNAAPNQVINFNFGDDIASGGTGLAGTTMFAGPSAITNVDVDGRGFGNLTELKISDDGTIEGVFDNGDRIALAKIAVADFASPEGLERQGDSVYAATINSGQPLIDESGTGNRGTMVSGALESSNVDLGTELVTLIAYQRAFQANAKTVTTADELMQEVTNIKR